MKPSITQPEFIKPKDPHKREKGQVIRDTMRLITTPAGFCEGLLGMRPYMWQSEILSWYADIWGRVKGAVAAPNGAGKSANIIAVLALWWLCMAKRSTVVITSADSRQIDHQIWPSILKHRERFPQFKFNDRHIVSPAGGEIVAFTTDEAGRAEGWHFQLPDKPLLMICDEAKSIKQPIFEAIDRCSFNALLLISSTGRDHGEFYRAMRGMIPGFKTRKVSLTECPHVDPARIADVIDKYGPDHPFVKSTLHSEFISEDEENRFFFTKEKVDMLIAHPPQYKPSTRIFYCDFGGGVSENVIAMRKGNRISICKAWHESNEMAACGQFVREFRRLDAEPSEIYGDNCGPGKIMINRLREVGWPINPVSGAERALREQDYGNRSAEMWDTAAMAVEQAEVILPDDEIMAAQLVSRMRGKPDSRGRLMAEGKDDRRKRGVSDGLDRADAVVSVIALGRPFWYGKSSEMITKTSGFQDSYGNAFDEWEDDLPPYYVTGSHAG